MTYRQRSSGDFFCLFVVSFLSLLAFYGVGVAGDFDWCGYSDMAGNTRSMYDYGSDNRANARYIFVSFPNDPSCGDALVDTLLYRNQHVAMIDSVKSWLASSSQGNFNFSDDTGFVLVPGHGFGAGDTAWSWSADLCARKYREVSTDNSPEVINYRCKWGFEEGGCDPVADLSSLITENNQSYLWSEILYKIYDSYVSADTLGTNWPFGDHDGVNDDAEKVEALIFVLMSTQEVFEYGGTIGISVNVDGLRQLPFGERFFGNIARHSYINSKLQGTFQLQDTSSYHRNNIFSIEKFSNVVQHEFMHTFNLLDGPPPLQSLTGANDIGRYYYGKLNHLCQKFWLSWYDCGCLSQR